MTSGSDFDNSAGRFELAERPRVEVSCREYARLLGYPRDYRFEGRALELAQECRSWFDEHGRPWIYGREIPNLALHEGRVCFGATRLGSERLFEKFAAAQVRRAVIIVVSAGPECEARAGRLWGEEKPDEYFFMEVFGSAATEALVTLAGARLCAWAERAGLAVLPHYSPGYSGWSLADQASLWRLLEAQRSGRFGIPGQVTIRESGMLVPKKSLVALFGLTSKAETAPLTAVAACAGCDFPRCDYRRVEYAGAGFAGDSGTSASGPYAAVGADGACREIQSGTQSVLDRDAGYTLNTRALAKWSRERLSLRRFQDGSIEARFRFEGTTCANMGVPLEFEYRLEVGPEREGYTIRRMECAPSVGDTGHRFMCGYLKDPVGMMKEIAADQPLLGRPLNAVVGWGRPASPSGCYCDAPGRLHKWGLVLEVLRYALAREMPLMDRTE